MISSRELIEQAPIGATRFGVDVDGRPLHGVLPESNAPALIVGPVTDAVKLVDAGSIVHHVDRDTLWAVEGLILDHAVLEAIPDFAGSAAELIEAVGEAGLAWEAVH